MPTRSLLGRPEPTASLPALERLAPAPPMDLVAARLEALTAPGDIVIDPHGRGGWIARAAVDRQRRAVSLETAPLTRLLAEVVVRPPDLRHLDAAFQSLAGSPRRDTSLKVWIGDRFATRCATCGRSLVLDELVWARGEAGVAVPATRHYRCTFCRDQRGGGEARHAPPEPEDLERALDDGGEEAVAVARTIRERFPVLDGDSTLVDELLGLYTARQLLGLSAILERVEGDLRAANVEAALRLAFLHALLPASRLNPHPGRVQGLRLSGGHVRLPSGSWRERNPWLAFEDGYRLVRGFIQRLESTGTGVGQVRLGDDLRALVDGPAVVSLRMATPSIYRGLAAEARDARRASPGAGARLVIGQPPLRPSADRLAFAFLATSLTLGREAASLLPLDAIAGAPARVPWGWQSAALTRSLTAVGPMLARDGRAVLLCEPGGEEALVAAVLGGIGAGYRLVSARVAEAGEEAAIVDLVPPGAALPPAARTRANVALPPIPGGAGDPDLLPTRALFAPPERFEGRPFSEAEAARTVTDAAVEVLKARGEPARTERLLGELLVGLDRAGHLRRLVAGGAPDGAPDGVPENAPDGAVDAGAGRAPARPASDGDRSQVHRGADDPEVSAPTLRDGPPGRTRSVRGVGRPAEPGPDVPEQEATVPAPTPAAMEPGIWERRRREEDTAGGQVERLLSLIRDELRRPGGRRLLEIEPDRWWLADRADRDAAALPLADRVEWAVFSLLSTAGPISEETFRERIAALFPGYDLPDEALVRACLESYRGRASTPEGLVSGDELLRRTHEHAELLALLADLGHRLGFNVWLSRREQERPLGRGHLWDHLEPRERNVHLPLITRAPEAELADVDAIWYLRGRATFHFEVEWTAMLSEAVLRRHARIPGDPSTVRFLVVVPERTELVRHKLERSPLLRAALEADNWHFLKTNHLRAFAELEAPTLEALEPLLGLDPLVERSGEQLPLFGS